MPGEGTGHPSVGAIRVITRVVEDGAFVEAEIKGEWSLFDEQADNARHIEAVSSHIPDVIPGLYTMEFATASATGCSQVLGWSGAEHRDLVAPVRGGAVTVIEQYCAAAR
jgi:hypothetical protein